MKQEGMKASSTLGLQYARIRGKRLDGIILILFYWLLFLKLCLQKLQISSMLTMGLVGISFYYLGLLATRSPII